MKTKHSRKKLNNQGMSLLEMLLAVMLISVVSVVFYNGFISSTSTNSKARLHHKATSLAQSIVESLKSENMDSIMHQFVFDSYTIEVNGEDVTYSNFDLLPDNIMGKTATGYAADFGTLAGTNEVYAVSEDGGKTATYKQTASDKYYLYMQNLDMDGTMFDAMITIDGSAYSADPTTNTSTSGKTYNDNLEAHIPVMDGNYDAVISGATTHDSTALSELQHQVGGTLVKSRIRREITVDVSAKAVDNGTEMEYEVEANFKYIYADVASGGGSYEITDYVFDNKMDHGKELRNVYLFFTPTDAETSGGLGWMQSNMGGDIIRVNNPDGVEFNLYLIKILPPGVDTDVSTPVYSNELGYLPQIYITGPSLVELNNVAPITIRTNLGYSVTSNAPLGDPVPKQARYFYNGVEQIGTAVDTVFGLASLTNKQKSDKLLDVTVDIYLHENDTTPSDKDDFINNIVGEKRATMQGTIRN